MNHFIDLCRSYKSSAAHNMEGEHDQKQESNIEMVNINFINFNSSHSTIIANLKTSNKITIKVPYEIGMGSDGNIMLFYMHKKLFPQAMMEQLPAICNTNITLKMYNQTTIT